MENLIDTILSDYTDIAAELSGYTETLNILQSKFCQFDGSEARNERNSTIDALHTLWRSMERFKEAFDEQVDGYYKLLSQPRPDPEKCEVCNIRKKGWCSPLKRYQCEYGYSDDEYIRLLILSLNDANRRLMKQER